MTDEQFVRVLYSGLLQRDADADGLASHVSALKVRGGGAEAYRHIVEAFIASAEFAQVRGAPVAALASNGFLPDFSGITFGHVVALGSFCHAAMALKKAGIRQWAGPFDWIFSNPAMVAHCIQDDFKTFLDQRFFHSVPIHERLTPEANRCEHLFYRHQFGVRFVFNHHDPAAASADADHFQNAVARFRQVLRSPAWKLLVTVSSKPVTLHSLEPLLAALNGATSRFVVLALQFNTVAERAQPAWQPDALRTCRLRHDLLKVELDVLSASDGVAFGHEPDNRRLERLLQSFDFRPEPPDAACAR